VLGASRRASGERDDALDAILFGKNLPVPDATDREIDELLRSIMYDRPYRRYPIPESEPELVWTLEPETE
jgi:hypothetical protein